jgi:hypothetical protein
VTLASCFPFSLFSRISTLSSSLYFLWFSSSHLPISSTYSCLSQDGQTAFHQGDVQQRLSASLPSFITSFLPLILLSKCRHWWLYAQRDYKLDRESTTHLEEVNLSSTPAAVQAKYRDGFLMKPVGDKGRREEEMRERLRRSRGRGSPPPPKVSCSCLNCLSS